MYSVNSSLQKEGPTKTRREEETFDVKRIKVETKEAQEENREPLLNEIEQLKKQLQHTQDLLLLANSKIANQPSPNHWDFTHDTPLRMFPELATPLKEMFQLIEINVPQPEGEETLVFHVRRLALVSASKTYQKIFNSKSPFLEKDISTFIWRKDDPKFGPYFHRDAIQFQWFQMLLAATDLKAENIPPKFVSLSTLLANQSHENRFSILTDLFFLAHRYGMDNLREQCTSYLVAQISNSCQTMVDYYSWIRGMPSDFKLNDVWDTEYKQFLLKRFEPLLLKGFEPHGPPESDPNSRLREFFQQMNELLSLIFQLSTSDAAFCVNVFVPFVYDYKSINLISTEVKTTLVAIYNKTLISFQYNDLVIDKLKRWGSELPSETLAPNIDESLSQFQIAYAEENYGEAIRLGESILIHYSRKDPQYIIPLADLAICYQLTANHPKAIRFLVNLANAYLTNDDFEKTTETCDEILELEPTNNKAKFIQAQVYCTPEKKELLLTDVLADPSSGPGMRAKASALRALCYYHRDAWAEMVNDCSEVIERSKLDKTILRYRELRALGYYSLKQYEAALTDITTVLENKIDYRPGAQIGEHITTIQAIQEACQRVMNGGYALTLDEVLGN